MTYNLTNFSSGGDVFAIVTAANETTGGAFLLLSLGVLFAILTMSLIRFGGLTAVTTSLFIVSLVGLLATLAGVVSVTFLPYMILPLALSVVGLFISKRGGG